MAVHVINHPLVRHKLGLMRRKNVSAINFRALCLQLTRILIYESTSNLKTQTRVVQGWNGKVKVEFINGNKITLVPILRAGLGMLDGALDLLPEAGISILGLYRDEETLEPVKYYAKLTPGIAQKTAIILDPMLATGGTLLAAIELLTEAGCTDIRGIFLVAAPEGLKRVSDAHPDIDIYLASLDQKLNHKGYILPGIGDAGDKLFNT